MTTSFLRESIGITSPITHAGRVVYNAKRDFLETRRRKTMRGALRVYHKDGFGDDECHTIQPYELCFRSKISRYTKYQPNDTDLSVFSNANGILISSKGADNKGFTGGDPTVAQEKRVQQMMADIEFAGVACNRAIYDPRDNHNEEGLAVQVGGLQTIYNTGDTEIYAGDIVLWDQPYVFKSGEGVLNHPQMRYSPGTPRIKRVFATKKLDQRALQEEFKKTNNIYDALFSLQRRVIGKAMSTSKPGQPFDILLGHYCI